MTGNGTEPPTPPPGANAPGLGAAADSDAVGDVRTPATTTVAAWPTVSYTDGVAAWRGATKSDFVISVQAGQWFSANKLRSVYGLDLPDAIDGLLFDRYQAEIRRLERSPDQFAIAATSPAAGPPYDAPPIIWGAGLNFSSHANDLEVQQPAAMPGSYCRFARSPIGHRGVVVIPKTAAGATAEAELGLVVGRTCKDVSEDEAASVVAGFTALLDFTAEESIRQNPRYIPWAKGFDDFFAFGPSVKVATPELWARLPATTISTVHNGRLIAEDEVKNMLASPQRLIEYFSTGRTLEAGSVICCGTPGAVRVSKGDTVEARVSGIDDLQVHIR